MSLIYSATFFQPNSMFSEEESKQLSKQRIIQKNLVHFQGFPDRLYDKELLCSQEYFGQYGIISKIILTSKVEKKLNRKSNSAYITFGTCEQAAYAILSVDSIKIDDQLVRAFFGTTKYCNHFLNNFECFNSEKCMFLHYIANKNDIIAENSKFGYSEHIKLAKKIVGFGSSQSRLYVMKNASKSNTILPSIVTIYHKHDILIKTKNHRRQSSKESNSSINNNIYISSNNGTRSSSNSSNRNISFELSENEKSSLLSNNNISIITDHNCNFIFKSKNKSRFEFANNNNNICSDNKDNNNELMRISQDLINEISLRLPFFIQFDKNIPLNQLEKNFCCQLYIKSKNNELKKIIENIY